MEQWKALKAEQKEYKISYPFLAAVLIEGKKIVVLGKSLS